MATNHNGVDYLGSAYPFTVIRDRLSRHPGPCLDFALGRHREAAPAWVPEFVREHSEFSLRRRQRDELNEFFETAATTLREVYGVKVAPDSILAAPSGRATMSALAATLISPGDDVLVTEPGYPAFARVAAQRHARLTAAALDPDKGFAPQIEESFKASPSTHVRVAALNYPNNPTGSVISVSGLRDLRQWLGPDAVLFNDAIYGPLTYERAPFSVLAAGNAAASGPTLELHSLGKLFSLGPLGLAFLIGTQSLVAQIGQYCDFALTQLSSLQVLVAIRCLRDWSHVDGLRGSLRRRLEELREVVSALGFEPYPVDAGMYLLCRGPAVVGGRKIASAAEAADVLLTDYGLAVAPWDVPPRSYVRFCASYLPEELAALSRLGNGGALVSS